MKPLIIALAVAHALDIQSSCKAFATGLYREGNPFVPSNCAAVTVAAAASSVVFDESAVALHHRKHDTVAKWMLVIVTAVEVESAVHNYRNR